MFLFGLNLLDDNLVNLVVYFKGHSTYTQFKTTIVLDTYYVPDIGLSAMNLKLPKKIKDFSFLLKLSQIDQKRHQITINSMG